MWSFDIFILVSFDVFFLTNMNKVNNKQSIDSKNALASVFRGRSLISTVNSNHSKKERRDLRVIILSEEY